MALTLLFYLIEIFGVTDFPHYEEQGGLVTNTKLNRHRYHCLPISIKKKIAGD